MSDFIYEKDADGIVTVTMDIQGQPVNTMNDAFISGINAIVKRLEAEPGLTGVIIASAKSTFFAGGDIKLMLTAKEGELQPWKEQNDLIKAPLRALENLKVPVVAAINGAALGGGYEICLSCHHRVAINGEKVLIGLPESTLGLLPGAGGVIRLVRMLGLEKALPLLLAGTVMKSAEAFEKGLVNELVADRDEMFAKARAWIKANPNSVQPWNEKGYKIPGGTQKTNPAIIAQLQAYPGMLAKQFGANIPPAPKAILSAAAESLQVDFDSALQIETRYFLPLLVTKEAKERMTAFVEKRK
jgi:3-hydroxyacyl-CoA dehydrogenase/enoyl-CoA hydratase/3-hydroxybutyryl-CoA epimerase